MSNELIGGLKAAGSGLSRGRDISRGRTPGDIVSGKVIGYASAATLVLVGVGGIITAIKTFKQ